MIHSILWYYIKKDEVIDLERLVMNDLLAWKQSKHRKPLIVKGARQVGKTWILKEFGNQYYKNTAYFNFDENLNLKQFFEVSKDVNRIIQNLMFFSKMKIEENNTLIIFDEVQDCPEVINSLKYFCENANGYHIVCAGSLLGVSLSKPSSFPVGKVDFLDLYPMNFKEFLMANQDDNLVNYLESIDSIESIPNVFFDILVEKLKLYYITGGMPESVKMWAEDKNIELMQKVQSNILISYERDFMKHPNVREFPKISLIWNSIPSQLAKENKKIIYQVMKKGARSREYEDALEWLVNASLIYKIYRSEAPRLPLSAYDDLSAYKLYLVDVGLLGRHAKIDPSIIVDKNKLFTEFKGAFSENYILQSLIQQYDVKPRYWSQVNPSYEIDFIIQRKNLVIPIEVKVDQNVKRKNLIKFKEKFFDDVKLRVRYSLENLTLDNDILNIPLFMADYTDKLIELALTRLENQYES